jgi:hypothetical protein
MPAAAKRKQPAAAQQKAAKKPAGPRAVISASPAKAHTQANARALALAVGLGGQASALTDECTGKRFRVWHTSSVTVEEDEDVPDDDEYESDGDGGNIHADSYDRFAGAKTHSGAFAGFAIKKLTADDLGDTCKPDRSASCPMAACKGKLMTGHDTNEDAENIYDKLDISELCKQCFDLDYADGEVSMCVSEQRFPTDASHALASACCARDSIYTTTGLLGFVCQGRS